MYFTLDTLYVSNPLLIMRKYVCNYLLNDLWLAVETRGAKGARGHRIKWWLCTPNTYFESHSDLRLMSLSGRNPFSAMITNYEKNPAAA